jgi:hypothetical protein
VLTLLATKPTLYDLTVYDIGITAPWECHTKTTGSITGKDGTIMIVEAADAEYQPHGESAWIFKQTAPGPTLPWSWARDRLENARTYWVVTASTDGFPHSRPVWGRWYSSSFWFSTRNRAINHLAKNPRASVNIQQGDDIVVVEGHCEAVLDVDRINILVDGYASKYSWQTSADTDRIVTLDGTSAPVYRLDPIDVYGWSFRTWGSATRWSFPD